MSRYIVALAAGLLVWGCGGTSPFVKDDPDAPAPAPTAREGLPPGTPNPTPTGDIFRSEPTKAQGGKDGDGFAQGIQYDAASDTFSVDNLGFDGDNDYARGTAVNQLGPYAVYEAKALYPDSMTGTRIGQFTHRAIYGVSTSGKTEFAIVRTGSYVDYGFGGFIYQRDGGVTLPTSGQAAYRGEISGIRDFNGAGGMQYSHAKIDIAIDFEDFNDSTGMRGDAVRGIIYDRKIFDINGNEVTNQVIDNINQDAQASLTAIPVAEFEVGPGVMDNNGEIIGGVNSFFVNNAGENVRYEEGKYYAVVAGENAEEIVGVVVTESTAGQPSGVTVRETGGFVVYRN